MVGVAGRSKGCNTCKKRKVACSLEQPECRTCIKSGRACAGYFRERVFVFHEPAGDRQHKSKSQTSYQGRKQGNNNLVSRRTERLLPANGHSTPRAAIVSQHLSLLLPASHCLSNRKIYRELILSEFLSCTIARSGPQTPRCTQPSDWLSFLPDIALRSASLETTILALCTARIGRINGNFDMVHQSLKLYTEGLSELQRALRTPKLAFEDQTLAACMGLLMYEVVECPNGSTGGWLQHTRGCSYLFEARGPKSYTSDFGHSMFLSYSKLEIQQAILERRSTFLVNPEWSDIVWKGRVKPTWFRLIDIMAHLANEIAKASNLIGGQHLLPNPANPLLYLSGVVDRCFDFEHQIQSFYDGLEREASGPLYWHEVAKRDTESVDAVFPVAYKFANLQTANICTTFWATRSILWSGMAIVYNIINQIQSTAALVEERDCASTNRLSRFLDEADITELARNICQSLEYCSHEEFGTVGSTSTVFPLKVAIEVFEQAPGCHRELDWAQGAMERISTKGVRIMGHLGHQLGKRAFLLG